MNCRYRSALFALVSMFAACPSGVLADAVATPVAESQERLRAADSARQAGRFDQYVSELEAALTLNPASLRTRHNLAAAYAQSGRDADALRLLEELAAAGVDFGVAGNPDFDALADEPQFVALLGRLTEATEPRIASEAHAEFAQFGLVPEGIAADADSGRLFFGSMRTGEIYALDARQRISRFAVVDRLGRLSTIGLSVDPGRGLLWAIGSGTGMAEGFDESQPAGLFGFDLRSGELRRQHRLSDATLFLNDVTVGPRGRVYVSGAGIWTLDGDALAPLETSIEIFAGNGLAVDAGGRTLFVASYPVGIAAVDIASGTARFLQPPGDVSLYGVDGLYRHGAGLVAIQNGIRPWRLLKLTVDAERTAVTAARVIELGVPDLIPTTGAIIGGSIYYIGEGRTPHDPPEHFPPAVTGNLGPVLLRRALLVR